MLLKFFLTCNKIGAFTLGGGYAMIPIMEREYVDKNHWLSREEFMDIMVVAQTTPGIFSIDIASHIGRPAVDYRHPAHRHLLPQLQGQRLRGEILPRRATGRGGAHRRTVLQDGTYGPYHVGDKLDTGGELSAHSGPGRLADMDYPCGRSWRLRVWSNEERGRAQAMRLPCLFMP